MFASAMQGGHNQRHDTPQADNANTNDNNHNNNHSET